MPGLDGLRHRQRTRCEDHNRCAKDTGLGNLPLRSMAQNAIWCQIVALACDLLTWTQLLALDGEHRAGRLPVRVILARWQASAAAASGARRPAPAPQGTGAEIHAKPAEAR